MIHRLTRGWRKYALIFTGMFITGALGLAAASWFAVPNGSGKGYGKGAAASGLALVTLDYSGAGGVGHVTTIGPSATGSLTAGISNPNTFSADLHTVVPRAGQPMISVDDSTCTAPSTTWTLASYSGTTTIAAGASADISLALTTTASFPSCLSGHVFSMILDMSGAPTGG